MGRTQHPKTQKCDLCGRNYAILDSTFRTGAYNMRFCRKCTFIITELVRKVGKLIREAARKGIYP